MKWSYQMHLYIVCVWNYRDWTSWISTAM